MKMKVLLILFLTLLNLRKGFSQNATPYIPKVLSPSPNAASLMKFTDVPVSTYNGTADVSVPFYTVDVKDISIPVGISYHTGGVRIKDESGLVGLGWALNAGGMISREFRDQDDFGGEYFNEPVPEISANILQQPNAGHTSSYFGYTGYIFFCDYLLHTDQGNVDYSTALQGSTLIWDMEPDIFSYNFPGHSGKFMITRTGKILMQKQENIIIQYSSGGGSFTITDDQGNKFYFADKELVQSANYVGQRTSSWMLTSIFTQSGDIINFTYQNDNTWSFVPADIFQMTRSGCSQHEGSFYSQPAANQYLNLTLQKIDYPKGQIQFQTDNVREDLQNGKKLNSVKIYTKATSSNALTYLKEYDLYYSYFFSGLTPAYEYERLRLDSLKELSTGISLPPYQFFYNALSNSFFAQKHGYAVDHWGFCNGQGNSSFIPTFSALVQGFYQNIQGANRESNFQFSNGFSLNQINYPTGGHTSLEYESNTYDQVASSNGAVDFPNFQLVSKSQNIQIATRGTVQTGSVDLTNIYPVTYSSSNATLSVAFRVDSAFTVATRNTCGSIYFTFNGVTYDVCSSDPNFHCTSSLCNIIVPITIGSAHAYTWTGFISTGSDPHFIDINAIVSWQEIATAANPHLPLNAGGLRIKSITDYSSNGIAAKKRRYAYDNETPGNLITSGRLMSPPSYARLEPLYYQSGQSYLFGGGTVQCNSLTLTGSSNTSISSVINGNIVGYDTVKEYEVDPVTGIDIGKTVYAYFNSADTVLFFNGFTMPGLSNIGNTLNGSLLSKIVYKNVNNTYTPVTESDNYYHPANRTTIYSAKYNLLTNPSGYSTDCPGNSCIANEYQADFYPSLKSEKILLDSTFETLYDQMDPTRSMVTKKYYSYDNPKHYQVTRVRLQDSKGNTIINNTKFPQDYIPTGNTLSGNTILDSMIKKNMVASTIENRDSLYFNGSSSGLVTSAKLNTYKILSSGPITKDKIFSLTVASPISNFTPFTVNNNVTSQDSRYRQMISFDSYDNLANLKQYTATDQIPISFIWDYANMYPTAQVKNAVSSDIAFTSFEADGSGNWNFSAGGDTASQVAVNVNAANTSNIFTSQTPVSTTSNDYPGATSIQGVEDGVKFTSTSAGYISGIRFYKTTGNAGTHIGELYSSTGTRLAQATFTNETATGWQTVSFSSPVTITTNTTYIAAYFSSLGNYVEDNDYFLHTSVTNSPLTAPADGTNGGSGTDPGSGQGLYKYTASAAFPNQLYRSANYWVDVVFSSGSTPAANAGSNQTITLPMSSVTLNGSSSMGIITSYSWTKISGPNSPAITTPTNVTTTVTGLIAGTYVFQLSVNSGVSTSQVTITVLAAGTPTNIFTTQTPVSGTSNDYPGNTNIQGVEDGVKFTSGVAGTITGIRFYKTTGNSGTHIGELYSSTGVRLAQATFTGETSSGWQTVTFSSPVTITANTSYTAAYFSSLGYYAEDNDYFLGHSVVNSSLTAPADGTNGASGTDPGTGQGVYKYTASAAFPDQLYRSANYWVDVLFVTGSSPVANAGSNQTIALPVSSVGLDGRGSTGTITSYLWTKLLGPNNPTITTPTSPTTNVTGLVQGSYVFQLSLNGGVSSSYALTGSKSYNLNGNTISKSGLVSGNKYIVSYWSRGSACNISGGTSTSTVGRTANGWTYYEHIVTLTSTAISVTGTNYIDELRLYPQGSQMTSLTYTPLVGATASNDLNSEITFYDYDSLQRLKNVRDYQGNITNNYQYNYAKPCTSCNVSMQTLAHTPTISYPVGVFSVNKTLIGNATTAAQYISLWNSDAGNHSVGTLAAGADSMHFILTVNSGQVSPGFVTGCRYYQVDLAYTQIDAVRYYNGAYVDFGDGTGMMLGTNAADTSVARAPNTSLSIYTGYCNCVLLPYWIHNYPDASQKTITFYHNDDENSNSGFDNFNAPANSLMLVKNLRGNIPQRTLIMGGSCYQQPTAQSVAAISNWNQINSVTEFSPNNGDGINPCRNLNYAQDFMANNKNLKTINTSYYGVYGARYRDTTFRISRLKSDWNTYFSQLTTMLISDDHWNREDLSGMLNLKYFALFATNQNHSDDPAGNPIIPIPSSVVDNILNQIAAGAGRRISNGTIQIVAGNSRTSASDSAVSLLTSKGWTLSLQ